MAGELKSLKVSHSEIPNTSGGAPGDGEAVKGDLVAMGDLADEDGAIYEKSMLIQFASVEDFHAARKSGQCKFTVLGGDV